MNTQKGRQGLAFQTEKKNFGEKKSKDKDPSPANKIQK